MSLITTLLPNYASDAVAVFDQNFNQVFPDATPMKINVKRESKLMEHPIETGATVTDHVVILPIEIEFAAILQADDFRSVYAEIENLYLSSELLTIQTKTSTYTNMLIQQMPHIEESAMFNAITVGLKFKEVDFVAPETGTLPPAAVSNPTDASTVSRGEQQTSTVSAAQDNTPGDAATVGDQYYNPNTGTVVTQQ